MAGLALYSYAKVQSIEIDGKEDFIALRPVFKSNLFNSLEEGCDYAFQTIINGKSLIFEAVVDGQGPNIALELGNDVAAAIVETLDQNEDNKISDREFEEGMENALVSADYDESLPWLDLDDETGELVVNRNDEDSYRRLNIGLDLDEFSSYRRVKLYGGDEDDVIVGQGHNDELFGGDGDDTLIGGSGRDFLVGGEGADTFQFNSVEDSRPGGKRDVITDFNGEEGDRIDLSNIQTATTYIGSAEFSGSPGEVRFENGLLQLSTDRDSRPEFEIQLLDVDKEEFQAADVIDYM